MNSLYDISISLQNIFNDIEYNGGEISDEQYQDLQIKQEELKDKLYSYYKAIKVWENNANSCKEEKKRINDVQNKYKNRILRLKQSMLDAIQTFGEEGKNNKYIELPTVRLYTKSSKSIEENTDRINIFILEFEQYVRELVNNDVLDLADINGVLDCINANCKANYGDNFEPFTINDLINIKININQTASVYDLLENKTALNLYGKEPIYTNMENVTSKDSLKENMKSLESSEIPITIAKVVVNQSLQMK